ncbi:MAG: peptidylprolyl isomerase, partial [Bacteroidales bacterium]|nr:peptidylprolyl isomerase [Bacteroidales bacterium]
MNPIKTILISFFFIICGQQVLMAQNKNVIDQVVAIVGGKAILQSDIESQIMQIKAQGIALPGDPYCVVLEDLLFQKLLY